MSTGSILVVDDEAKILRALASALRADGHDVATAGGGRDAQRLLAERPFDVLVLDNLMPDLTGLDLIREIAASTTASDRPHIVMMTAYATVENAIEAMKLGAFDYLQKPSAVDRLHVHVRRPLDDPRLHTPLRHLVVERTEDFHDSGNVARRRVMRQMTHTAGVGSQSTSTVHISG